MIVVIGRASGTPEVGAVAHLPSPPLSAVVPGATVVSTVCGATVIAQAFDRPEATCAVCLASAGQHPGKRGKAYLTKHYRPVPRPTSREDH